MSWPRQVVHVAWRDLRGAKWLLLGYACYVVYAALTAIGWPTFGPNWRGGPTELITLVTMCVAAQFVLSDSPVRFDNFWATRPLAPSAVVVAKVVAVFVGVMTPGLVAGLIVLEAFRIPTTQTADLLAGGMLQQAMMIVVALAIAALVGNLWAFLATLIVAFVGVIALAATRVGGDGITITLSTIPIAATLVLCVFVVSYQYATRRTTLVRWIAAAGAVAMVVAGELALTTPASAGDAHDAPSNSSVTAIATLLPHSSRGEVRVVAGDLASGQRLALVDPRLYIEVAGRRRDSLTVEASNATGHPALQITRGMRGLSRTPATDSVAIQFSLTDLQRAMLADRDSRLRLEGTLEVDRQHVVGQTPFRVDKVARMEGVLFVPGELWRGWKPEFAVRQRTLDAVTVQSVFDLPSMLYSFAVINEERREFLVGAETGYYNTSSGFLTLPASLGTMSDMAGAVSLHAPNDSITIDKAWLRDAQLAVVRWDEVRRYPVSVIVR